MSREAFGNLSVLAENLAHHAAHFTEPVQIERGESNLDRARVIELSLRLEIHTQSLSQRFQPLNACGPSKNAFVPVISRESPGNRPE